MTTVAYATRDAGMYNVGGALYPSITHLLRGVGDDYPTSDGDTFYLDRGTLTHNVVQAFLEKIIGPGEIRDWLEYDVMQNGFDIDLNEVLPGAVHGVEWCRRHVRAVRRIEVPGVNLTIGYACRPDWFEAELVDLDGLAIIDGKRQASKTPLRKALAQIAAQYHLEHVALATGPGEVYRTGDIRHFGNLCITDDGAFLRTYTADQVDRAFRHCVVPMAMKHYYDNHTDGWCDQSRRYMQVCLESAFRKFDDWESEPRRKKSDPGAVGCWPAPVPVLRAPRSKTARRSAADVRAARNAEAFGFTEVQV